MPSTIIREHQPPLPGTSSRLSGLAVVALERRLKWVELRGRLGLEQAIEGLGVGRSALASAKVARCGRRAPMWWNRTAWRCRPVTMSRNLVALASLAIEQRHGPAFQPSVKNAIAVAHGVVPGLVSGSSAKRPEPSGINAMLLVYKNSTEQPWHIPATRKLIVQRVETAGDACSP
jgi:hypothetical protein